MNDWPMLNMEKELEEFEIKTRDIFYHVARFGVMSMFNGGPIPDSFDSKRLKKLCLQGYKIAQPKILQELRVNQVKLKDLNEQLKHAKRDKDKDGQSEILGRIGFFEYQADVYRNLADSIAWQMVNGQHYFYRRLFTHESGEKNLSDKAFDHVIDYAKRINEDDESFCLINDITNNIQLGDCLVSDKSAIKIVEIKSGSINEKAFDIIHEKELTEENFDKDKLQADYDPKFLEQVKRILTQNAKTARAANIIESHKGPDPKFKDSHIKIYETESFPKTYHRLFGNMLKQLVDKDWAYECIEGVVHIGAYKGEWTNIGQLLMKQFCDPFPFYDLMVGRGKIICEPIFLKPLPDDYIMDIVMKRIRVFVGVDVEKLIELANELQIKTYWSSKKEFNKLLDDANYNTKEFYSFDNKGLIIEVEGKKMFLGKGFIFKMMFDHFVPSAMIKQYYQAVTDPENGLDKSK